MPMLSRLDGGCSSSRPVEICYENVPRKILREQKQSGCYDRQINIDKDFPDALQQFCVFFNLHDFFLLLGIFPLGTKRNGDAIHFRGTRTTKRCHFSKAAATELETTITKMNAQSSFA